MKKLVSILFILCTTVAFSQKYEGSLGVGISTNGMPSDNQYYQGDKSIINYSIMASFMQNFGKYNWQAGIEYNGMPLANRSSKKFPGLYSHDSIGGDSRKFVYSTYTNVLAFVANKKYDLADLKFTNKTLSNLKLKGTVYAGIFLGFAQGNNSNTHDTTSSKVAYTAPDGPVGPVYGFQLGYRYPINDKLSVNLEAGLRYYYLYYLSEAPHGGTDSPNLHFGIMAFPVTVGVTYNLSGLTKAANATDAAKKMVDANADVEGE